MTSYGSTRGSVKLNKAFDLAFEKTIGRHSASAGSENTAKFGVAANAEWDKLQRGEFDTAGSPAPAGSAPPLKSASSRPGGGLVKKFGLFSPRGRARAHTAGT